MTETDNTDMCLPENNGGYKYDKEKDEWIYVGEDGEHKDPMDVEFRIYCNGFWGNGYGTSFTDRTTSGAMNVNFFASLFEKTCIKNFIFVEHVEQANVLFESVFASSMVYYKPDWKYKIHYSGESIPRTELYFPNKSNYADYDVVMCSHGIVYNNIVDVPFFVYYCYNGGRLSRLEPDFRYYKHHIADKFCCYIVSNGNINYRNKIFDIVSTYKHVDSGGRHRNNIGIELEYPYTSEELICFISQYKFMICFENTIEGTYITEKLINPFLARTIPIYFGTNYVTNVFNKNAFLMLEDESEASYNKLLAQIKELDEDDTKYVEMLNQPVFNPDFDYNSVYGIDALAEKINLALEPPSNTYTHPNDMTFPENVRNTYVCLMAYRARHPQEFRREEMRNMIANWKEYFRIHDKDLQIMIVEQDNDKPFNKGLLWNAAFLEAEKYFDGVSPKYYMHNNSDNLINMGEPFPPDVASPDVGFTDIRRVPHLDEYIGGNMLGGCCLFDGPSYRETNGFPNNIWGWGGDDWALMRRIRERNVPYKRSVVFNSNWMIENRDHVRDKKANDQNIQIALTEPIEKSGLNDCTYNIMRFGEFYDEENGVIHLCIDS